jgi:predicted dehydrogenase
MKAHRIAVIGLGQRIAHVLGAMAEVGWALEVAGYADPSPVGAPILTEFGIDPAAPILTPQACSPTGRSTWS